MVSDYTTYSFADLLSNIVDNRGKTCPVEETGLPLIATNCVKNDTLFPAFEKVRYVNTETYDTWFRGHPKPDDIIFVCKGAPGNVCWTPNPVNFCIAQDMVAIRADEKIIDPKFLFALLRSQSTQNKILNMHVGTMIPHFKKGDFKNLYFDIPNDKVLQKQVGEIYFNFCEKIELNRQINETLEAMAQALFKSWFVDFDPVIDNALAAGNAIPDEFAERAEHRKGIEKKDNTDIQSLFPDEFEFAEEMGWIPKGWESVKLDKLLEVKYGKDHKKLDEGTIPVYGSGGLMRHVNKSLYIGESILIPRKGTLSNLMFVDEEFWTVDTMFFSIPKFSNIAKYIFHHLKLLDLTSMNVGSAVPSMTTKVLNDLDILYPCENTLKEFNRLVTDFYNRSSSLNSQNETLAKLRDTLLPKLMSGEIRIPDAAAFVENI